MWLLVLGMRRGDQSKRACAGPTRKRDGVHTRDDGVTIHVAHEGGNTAVKEIT